MVVVVVVDVDVVVVVFVVVVVEIENEVRISFIKIEKLPFINCHYNRQVMGSTGMALGFSVYFGCHSQKLPIPRKYTTNQISVIKNGLFCCL